MTERPRYIEPPGGQDRDSTFRPPRDKHPDMEDDTEYLPDHEHDLGGEG